MPTTNLGLTIINHGDNVSPDPINNNMQTLDALGVDYIVQQGTSGNWRYRRWKSGTYECWGTYKQQTASPTVEDDDYGAFEMAYPITFVVAPQLFVSARQDGRYQCFVAYVEHETAKAVWYVGNMASGEDLECYLYAIGRVS